MTDLKKTPADYIADIEQAAARGTQNIADTAQRSVESLQRLPADLAAAERMSIAEASVAVVLDFTVSQYGGQGTLIGLTLGNANVAQQIVARALDNGPYRAVILITKREDP